MEYLSQGFVTKKKDRKSYFIITDEVIFLEKLGLLSKI